MKLRKFCKNSSQIVFCAYDSDRTSSKRDFIVVTDLDSEDRFFALRKSFVAEYLEFVAETDRDVSWADIDIEVSAIMSAKFHKI